MSDRLLVIVRHAKAEDGDDDHARRLTERGRRDAVHTAQHLAELGIAPARVLCSDAARTRETWERMAVILGGSPAVAFLPELYLAEPDVVWGAIEASDGSPLLVLGHNPGLESLVQALTGRLVPMSTGAAAVLGGPDWDLRSIFRP